LVNKEVDVPHCQTQGRRHSERKFLPTGRAKVAVFDVKKAGKGEESRLIR